MTPDLPAAAKLAAYRAARARSAQLGHGLVHDRVVDAALAGLLSVCRVDEQHGYRWRGDISWPDMPLGQMLDELKEHAGGNPFDYVVTRLIVTTPPLEKP